jgi:hypothetical protein
MPTSAWRQGESLKQLLQGAAVGAFATLGIGFSWGGWMLGSTAKTLADSTANSAVVAAIAPICVPTQRRRCQQPDGAEKEDQRMGTGDLCRKRRLGGNARKQGDRLRRYAGLRRNSQQLEIGYER